MSADKSHLSPDCLIDGAYIDGDLGIVDRTRRKMVSDGRLPPPVGFIGGRARWRLSDYVTARDRLLASGRPRRPGATSAQAA
jgi:hypothetical protein